MNGITKRADTCANALPGGAGIVSVELVALALQRNSRGECIMGVLVVVAVVILSSAVLSGTNAPFKRIEVDRMPPPVPANLAAYEAADPDSMPTSEPRLIALAH
jgi:hypothetical protein